MAKGIMIQTHYSLNGSLLRIDDAVANAKSNDITSIMIADLTTSGYIQFYKACQKHHIHPIFALTKTIHFDEWSFDVIIIAKNNQGYRSLLKIASNELCVDDLEQYNNVIYLLDLAAFRLSDVQLNVIRDSVEHISLINTEQPKPNDDFKVQYIRYLKHEHHRDYNALRRIFDLPEHQLTFEFKKDAIFSFESNHPLASCHVEINLNAQHLPSFPSGYDNKIYLYQLANKGLEKRLLNTSKDMDKYRKRLEYELSVIHSMGYDDYFLIVYDFVKYAKNHNVLVGPGRGSAPASLVAYCLGITDIDPIEFNLIFERFLNPERISMPDIDIDFPDEKREMVIQYVAKRYGKDHVATISTFGTFQIKSALRDTARVYDIDEATLKQLLSYEVDSMDDLLELDPVKRLMEEPLYRHFLTTASLIQGLNRHIGTHAAGIIITGEPITNYSATKDGLLGLNQTQFEAKDLETLGCLKFDFLGLRNLSIIERILDDMGDQRIAINKIPLNDQKAIDLLRKNQLFGIFQLESMGMRQLISKMGMSSFDDIVTVLALYRPGPMDQIPLFLNRRHKKEEITYVHSSLEPILESTQGILIYQEQILKLLNEYAGYTLAEADLVRRAVSKKDEEALQEERRRFINKASLSGHKEDEAETIYEYIIKFANYGFNKAHSVSYALVAYWMLYLKAHVPSFFVKQLLNASIGSVKSTIEYIKEAIALNVNVQGPSINNSGVLYTSLDNVLYMPLTSIKYIGKQVVLDIQEERKNGDFSSFIDCVKRLSNVLNKRHFEYLIKSGAFDELNQNRHTMLANLDGVLGFSKLGQFVPESDFIIDEHDPYSIEELSDIELEALGFNLKYYPLNQYDDYIKRHGLLTPSDVDIPNTIFRMIGQVDRIKEITTKNGLKMAFVQLSDQLGVIDCVLFPNVYDTIRDQLETKLIILMKGRIDQKNGRNQFVCQNIKIM